MATQSPLRLSAASEPELFLARFPPAALIDEVQYAPELFAHIKMAVDTARRPGMYWLTGSQAFHRALLPVGANRAVAPSGAILVGGPPRAESRRGGAPTIRLAAAPARYDAATPRDRAFDFWRRVGKARTTSPTDA